MVEESLNGQMEEDMKETTWMMKKVDMENSIGLIIRYSKATGTEDSCMEKVIILHLMEKLKEDYGRMEKDRNGIKTTKIYFINEEFLLFFLYFYHVYNTFIIILLITFVLFLLFYAILIIYNLSYH